VKAALVHRYPKKNSAKFVQKEKINQDSLPVEYATNTIQKKLRYLITAAPIFASLASYNHF
jgi:hypothetical protein